MRESALEQFEAIVRWMVGLGAGCLALGVVAGVVSGQWFIAIVLFGGSLGTLPAGIVGIFALRAATERLKNPDGKSNSYESPVITQPSPLVSLRYLLAVIAVIGGFTMVIGLVIGLRLHRWEVMGVLIVSGGLALGLGGLEYLRLSHAHNRHLK